MCFLDIVLRREIQEGCVKNVLLNVFFIGEKVIYQIYFKFCSDKLNKLSSMRIKIGWVRPHIFFVRSELL